MEKIPVVYIMASRPHGVLYVGVTSQLARRVWQHKQGQENSFTARYRVKKLVWFEVHATMESAILREKQLKAGSRARKIALIETMNLAWKDLADIL
jgi:putative endonuclease